MRRIAYGLAYAACLLAAVPAPATAGNRQPLTERGLQNLHAFARLYGDVGYFHPSDQVRETDWTAFALNGVPAVEDAKSPAALAATLRSLFLPVAPTLRIYPTGSPPPPPSVWLRGGHGEVLTGFRYEGYPSGNSSAYRRGLVFPLKHMSVVTVDLGGGVSAAVPITLYRDGTGTLPHGTAPASHVSGKRSGNDRTTRLADVVMAWNVFQHFYPYFDVEPVDWPGELDKALRAAATDKDAFAFRSTLRRLVATLHDGHGWVFFKNHPTYGLPLAWDWAGNRLVVTAVGKGVRGLVRGDVVEKIAGRSIRVRIAQIDPMISAATPQWRDVIRRVMLADSDTDDAVAITVRHADGTTARVSLKPVKVSSVLLGAVPQPHALEPAKEVEPGIWYVDLSRTDGKALDRLLPQLAKAKGVVFDLRRYPAEGAYKVLAHLSATTMFSAQFNIPVITRPDYADVAYDTGGSWVITPEQPRLRGKIVFLAGGGTISYGESIMAIVGYYHLGEIVGGPTAGTNGDVSTFSLPGGYVISWTAMRVLTQDGRRFDGVGVKPDVAVARTLAGIRAGRDEVLEKGLAIAGGRN